MPCVFGSSLSLSQPVTVASAVENGFTPFFARLLAERLLAAERPIHSQSYLPFLSMEHKAESKDTAEDLSSPKRRLLQAKMQDEKYETDEVRRLVSEETVAGALAGALASVMDEIVIRVGMEEKVSVHK
jgi:hypothetical protein